MFRPTMRFASMTFALTVLFAGPAYAQSLRDVQVIDADGARIERQVVPWQTKAPAPDFSPRVGVIWHYNDPAGIIESCVLSDATNETWLGVNLNSERLMYLETTGDGTPIYEFGYAGDPDLVTVASAETASLAAVLIEQAATARVEAFIGADGDAPIWVYNFPSLYDGADHFGIDVSADGSLVAAMGFTRSSPFLAKLVLLDGATGAVIDELDYDSGARYVELSEDGSRAVVTNGDTARIYETATLTELFSFSVSGTGGVARISRNGEVAAAGGFNGRAFRDTGSGWVQVFSQQESTQWYGAMAISGDGDTLFAGSRNFQNNTITLRFIDLVEGTEISRWVSTPTGANQDLVARAEVSMDGSVIAVATWGQETKPHPEVMIFDREGNMIGEINMPGSAWTVDLSADGRYVVASGKNVHANDWGNGGDAYVYEVDLGPTCPEDINGDGFVDHADLAILLAVWGSQPGDPNWNPDADINGDGQVGHADLAMLLAMYGKPCP